MMRGPSRDNGDTHNFREWQPQLLIHKCHHCPLRTRIEMKKSLLFYKGTGSLPHFHPARVRDNGDWLMRVMATGGGRKFAIDRSLYPRPFSFADFFLN